MATLSNLITYISSDYLSDPNNKIWSQASITRALNIAQNDMQKDLIGLLNNQDSYYSFSTVVWTQSYTLPTDFVRLSEIRYNGRPLVKTTRKQVQDTYTTITSGQPYRYYIWDNTLYVNPNPDAVGTIDMLYTASYTIIDSSNPSGVPTDLEQALLMRACVILFKQKMKFDASQMRDQEYQVQLNKAVQWLVQDENMNYDTTKRRSRGMNGQWYWPNATQLWYGYWRWW